MEPFHGESFTLLQHNDVCCVLDDDVCPLDDEESCPLDDVSRADEAESPRDDEDESCCPLDDEIALDDFDEARDGTPPPPPPSPLAFCPRLLAFKTFADIFEVRLRELEMPLGKAPGELASGKEEANSIADWRLTFQSLKSTRLPLCVTNANFLSANSSSSTKSRL